MDRTPSLVRARLALLLVLLAALIDWDVIDQWIARTDGPGKVWAAGPGWVIFALVMVAIGQLVPLIIVVLAAVDIWWSRSRARTSTLSTR